jgi:hypothetical protein
LAGGGENFVVKVWRRAAQDILFGRNAPEHGHIKVTEDAFGNGIFFHAGGSLFRVSAAPAQAGKARKIDAGRLCLPSGDNLKAKML